jgi:hypothetical protein
MGLGTAMHLIIDADPIVYRCGFAAETPTYHLVLESAEGLTEAVFEPYDGQTAGARMQKFLQDHPDYDVVDKQKVVIPEPESHALEAIRTQLSSIERECRDYYGVKAFTRIDYILSGPGNYREKLATLFPYKGNRDPTHKPYWYQSIRNYLTKEFGARVVHGREADDECSIMGHRAIADGLPFVVATIDKDLDQIPGNHYNYLKQVFYDQSLYDSRSFFFQQCISGDATDGIPGCYKSGAVRAKRIIDSADGHVATSRTITSRAGFLYSDEGVRPIIWAAIVAEYERSKTRPGCPYVDRSAEELALETARLVYLQQKEGELWIPTGPPHDLLPEYRDEP